MAGTRECGTCTLCCKVMAIRELEKPMGHWCAHCVPGKGCGIYETRFEICRTFLCGWRQVPQLGDAWRPDRSKFLMYTEKNGQRLNVIVDPAQPGAWKREPYYRRIKAMSERALEGCELVVCIGDRRIGRLLQYRKLRLDVVHRGDSASRAPAGPRCLK